MSENRPWWRAFGIGTARLGGAALRGRVHRVSIVAGGEVSVVLRFGGEETGARALNQGTLVELREIPAPTSADPSGGPR